MASTPAQISDKQGGDSAPVTTKLTGPQNKPPSTQGVPQIYNGDEFLTFVKSSKMTIVLFIAYWCQASHDIMPLFKTIEKICPEIKIAILDVEYDDEEIAQALQLKVVPTFMTFFNGIKVGECQGASQEGLNSLLADLQRKAGIRRRPVGGSRKAASKSSLPVVSRSRKSVTSSSSSSRTNSTVSSSGSGSTFAARQAATPKKLPIKKERKPFR